MYTMSNQTAQVIRAVIVIVLFVGIIAFQAFTWKALMVHQEVINSQGTVLKFLLDTPEVRAVVQKEINRQQGIPQPEQTKTQK